VLVSNQLTLDGGLGSTWLKRKKKKELKALGGWDLVHGSTSWQLHKCTREELALRFGLVG